MSPKGAERFWGNDMEKTERQIASDVSARARRTLGFAYARLPCSTVSLAFFGMRAVSHSSALSCGIGKAME